MTATPKAEFHLIVLAAGASTRFGSPKQLAQVQGVPLLLQVLNRATAVAGHAVSVVLGAHASEMVLALARSSAAIVLNRDWEEGMAASIRAGIRSMPGSCGGALLLLADQVSVTVGDLQRLVDTWRRNPRCVVAAQYSGQLGVPAMFPRGEFAALLALRGEHGARTVLRNPAKSVLGVPMPSAALDIDYPEDLPVH